MRPFFTWVRDRWGLWAVDRAGLESGRHRIAELRDMLDGGEVGPKNWLRHVWTRRFSLVGETLYGNGFATEEEFEQWFPERKFQPLQARKLVG
ncbi:MAG: hypothetical protein ABL949_16650 [Fimbriimonadaceae bacterium]